MIRNVWSTTNGQTFMIASWDYLFPDTHSKGGEEEQAANLQFAAVPSHNQASCWGTDVMNDTVDGPQ